MLAVLQLEVMSKIWNAGGKNFCELGSKIVKNDLHDTANTIFKITKISVTSNGKRHLVAVICSRSYEEDYLNKKDRSVNKRDKTSQKLLKRIKIKPQCTLSYFISGYNHKLNYYIRMVPNISNLLRHTDNVVKKGFIPAINKVNITSAKVR